MYKLLYKIEQNSLLIYSSPGNFSIRLINTTPHTVDIVTDDLRISIPPSEKPLRLKEEDETLSFSPFGISFKKRKFSLPKDFPPEKEGVYYIVSLPVKFHFSDRKDFIVPDTIRDENNRIIGCKGFIL